MNPNGEEVYSSGPVLPQAATIAKSSPPPQPTPLVEDEDDVEAIVEPGTKCLRNGCKNNFVSQTESRGEGAQSHCTYHPKPVSYG